MSQKSKPFQTKYNTEYLNDTKAQHVAATH